MRRDLSALLLICLFFCCTSCHKDNRSPQEQLTAITDTGANTFSCLVDGKIFKPKRPFGSFAVVLTCQYQFVDGEQGFMLAVHNYIDHYSVVFNMDQVKIPGPTVYKFSYPADGQLYGRCGTSSGFSFNYSTYEMSPGEFRISKFDTVKQIISGTFWFDAIDTSTGKTVQIREGRFDVPFLR